MAYRPRYICLLPAPAAAEGASAKAAATAAAAPEGPSAEAAPGPSGTPEGASAEHASPAAAEAAPAECSAGGRPARWLWRSWRTGWPGPLGPSPEDGVVQHRGPVSYTHLAIILADEPTGNLDSATSLDVMGLLKVTAQKFSQTIVMITHNAVSYTHLTPANSSAP